MFRNAEAVIQTKSQFNSLFTRPEKASQTWAANAFVFVGTDGKVAQCDPTTPGNITKIAGLVPRAASGVTNEDVRIEPTTPDIWIKMSIIYTSDMDLAVTAETLRTGQFAIKVYTDPATSIDYWVVDIENTTDKCVQIQDIAPDDPIGTLNGAVYVSVLKDLCQFLA